MRTVRWSETAADDLQRIAEYIRNYDPRMEESTIGFIIDRADILLKYPRIGPLHETNPTNVETPHATGWQAVPIGL